VRDCWRVRPATRTSRASAFHVHPAIEEHRGGLAHAAFGPWLHDMHPCTQSARCAQVPLCSCTCLSKLRVFIGWCAYGKYKGKRLSLAPGHGRLVATSAQMRSKGGSQLLHSQHLRLPRLWSLHFGCPVQRTAGMRLLGVLAGQVRFMSAAIGIGAVKRCSWAATGLVGPCRPCAA
jgi:hypothetical protein